MLRAGEDTAKKILELRKKLQNVPNMFGYVDKVKRAYCRKRYIVRRLSFPLYLDISQQNCISGTSLEVLPSLFFLLFPSHLKFFHSLPLKTLTRLFYSKLRLFSFSSTPPENQKSAIIVQARKCSKNAIFRVFRVS